MVEVCTQHGYFFRKEVNHKTHQNMYIYTATHTYTHTLTQIYINFRFLQNLLSVFTRVTSINNLKCKH